MYTLYTRLSENTALSLSHFLNVTSSAPIPQAQTGSALCSPAGWLSLDKHIRHPAGQQESQHKAEPSDNERQKEVLWNKQYGQLHITANSM